MKIIKSLFIRPKEINNNLKFTILWMSLSLGFFYSIPNFCQAKLSPKFKLLGRWDNNNLDSLGDQTFSSGWGYTDSASGREYMIFGSTDSTYFADVTNPSKIKICDAVAGKFNRAVHREYGTYLHYAYGVCDEGTSSLQVFDLKFLPDSVHKVFDSDTFFKNSHHITIAGNKLFCSWPKLSFTTKPLAILLLENPEKPKLLTYFNPLYPNGSPIIDFVHQMTIKSDTAFLNCGNQGLFIYNFGNVDSPIFIARINNYPENGFNHSCTLSEDGNYLVFTDEDKGRPLKCFEIKKMRANKKSPPEFKGLFGNPTDTLGSIAHNPYVKGDLLYVSYYQDGVSLFDVSNPLRIKLLDTYDTYPQNGNSYNTAYQGCWQVYPYFKSGHIAAIDQANGLFMLGIDSVNSVQTIDDKTKNILKAQFSGNMLKVEVSENQPRSQIFLSDLKGNLLFNFKMDRESVQIPIPNLTDGLYLIQYINPLTNQSIKVIKQ